MLVLDADHAFRSALLMRSVRVIQFTLLMQENAPTVAHVLKLARLKQLKAKT
jgi:hypothetical protein